MQISIEKYIIYANTDIYISIYNIVYIIYANVYIHIYLYTIHILSK